MAAQLQTLSLIPGLNLPTTAATIVNNAFDNRQSKHGSLCFFGGYFCTIETGKQAVLVRSGNGNIIKSGCVDLMMVYPSVQDKAGETR